MKILIDNSLLGKPFLVTAQQDLKVLTGPPSPIGLTGPTSTPSTQNAPLQQAAVKTTGQYDRCRATTQKGTQCQMKQKRKWKANRTKASQ